MLRRLAVRLFWDRNFNSGEAATWLHEPVVRRRVNLRITGDENRWPLEWLADVRPGPFEAALSLGCGEGALERDLMAKGLVRDILGLDLSPKALDTARKEALEAGLNGIRYERADLDRCALAPESFDAVFVHQALHHVRALERCLDQVHDALRPGGLFYLDEYLGPSRHEWHRELLAEAETVYSRLPPERRSRARLELPVDWRDPSEAVRSSEILPLLEERFEVEEMRGYGGNLLSVIQPHLDLADLSSPERQQLFAELLDREDALLATGETSFYAIVIARKKV